MKRKLLTIISFLGIVVLIFILANCNGDEPEPNKPPTVSISNPANNASINKGETVAISVSASDPDGSISSVKISIDNTEVASLQSAPYSYSWNTADASTGQHSIKAVASDGSLSATDQITVNLETEANAPTVTTVDVTDITSNSAVGGGEVTDDGGADVTARGLVWGLSTEDDPTVETNTGITNEGTGTGSFSSTMESLESSTSYKVRAYATNSTGTAYGNVKNFQTTESQPAVVTANVTDIDAHVALGGGMITDFGGFNLLSGVGLVWSTAPIPDFVNYEGIYQIVNFTPSAENPFTAIISGLEPETQYFVRAFISIDGIDTYYGEEVSFTTTAFTVQTGIFTDERDGHIYETFTLNGQTWMAENLAYLPDVCASDADCGYWVYDYQGTVVDDAIATANYDTYGVLYNWQMANEACPTGWHLPHADEWIVLEMNIGMPYFEANSGLLYPGTDEGGKLKETGTQHWNAPNEGATNISMFTALPAGQRSTNQSFEWIGTNTTFWTSFGGNTDYHVRGLSSSSAQIYHGSLWEIHGFSVRCVQD